MKEYEKIFENNSMKMFFLFYEIILNANSRIFEKVMKNIFDLKND